MSRRRRRLLGGLPWYGSAATKLNGVSPSLFYDFGNDRYYNTAAKVTPFPFVATRTTNATMFNADGDMVWAPANLASNSATATASIAMSSTAGTEHNITTGVADAFGGFNAVRIEPLTGSCRGTTTSTALKKGQIVTMSLWARSTTLPFKLSLGALATPNQFGYFDLTSEWARYSVTFNLSTADTNWFYPIYQQGIATTGAGKFVEICGVQLQLGSEATTYIPTYGSVIYGPRLDHDPITYEKLGVRSEELRVNSCANSAMVNGVAPSTAPTGWSVTTVTGVTITYAYGTENGMPYIDVSYSGTNTTGAAAFPTINIGTAAVVAAANGESWVSSFYVRQVGGADSITSSTAAIRARLAGSLVGGQNFSAALADAATLSAGLQVRPFTFTAPVDQVEHVIQRTIAIGASIDITIRIGAPQLEQGVNASSHIPTYTVTATRGADALVNSTPWITQLKGTVYVEYYVPQTVVGRFPTLLQIDDSTVNNRVLLFVQANATTSSAGARIDSAGSAQVNTGVPSGHSYNTLGKFVFAYELNNSRMVSNGGTVVSDLVCAMPIGLTTLRVGSSTGAAADGRWVKSIRWYPNSDASDAQLQTLTT